MGNERKSVIMPAARNILEKFSEDPEMLRQAGIALALGEDVFETMAKFYIDFAKRAGGREADGSKLNHIWTQAAVATLKTPPTAGVLIRPLFPRIMTVTVPDLDVLEECLAIRKEYVAELVRLNKPERTEWAHLGDWD